jgi:hypothetical protein
MDRPIPSRPVIEWKVYIALNGECSRLREKNSSLEERRRCGIEAHVDTSFCIATLGKNLTERLAFIPAIHSTPHLGRRSIRMIRPLRWSWRHREIGTLWHYRR